MPLSWDDGRILGGLGCHGISRSSAAATAVGALGGGLGAGDRVTDQPIPLHPSIRRWSSRPSSKERKCRSGRSVTHTLHLRPPPFPRYHHPRSRSLAPGSLSARSLTHSRPPYFLINRHHSLPLSHTSPSLSSLSPSLVISTSSSFLIPLFYQHPPSPSLRHDRPSIHPLRRLLTTTAIRSSHRHLYMEQVN